MKRQLQIFKTRPATQTEFLAEKLGEGQEVTRFHLYENRDYDELVRLIFEHDEVISWW